jgi:hypothetical protein
MRAVNMRVWQVTKLEWLDDAAAEHAIESIEHRRLPWTQCALGFMEENTKGTV